jgi:DNA replication protein DnaC
LADRHRDENTASWRSGDWTELLAGDEVLTAAILDRLLHRSHVLNI